MELPITASDRVLDLILARLFVAPSLPGNNKKSFWFPILDQILTGLKSQRTSHKKRHILSENVAWHILSENVPGGRTKKMFDKKSLIKRSKQVEYSVQV